jgi:hypothetical protein
LIDKRFGIQGMKDYHTIIRLKRVRLKMDLFEGGFDNAAELLVKGENNPFFAGPDFIKPVMAFDNNAGEHGPSHPDLARVVHFEPFPQIE